MRTLVDSGVDIPLCKYKAWKKDKRHNIKGATKASQERCFIDYSGTWKKHVRGEVILPIRAGSLEFDHHFIVVERIT